MTTTLVTGACATAREAAIAAALDQAKATAVILEGAPGAANPLQNFPIHVARIAPGCLCCTGNLTMRVTLHRMLRLRPARLYISLATSAHLSQIQHFLSQPPYDTLLVLTKTLQERKITDSISFMSS